MFSTFFYKQKKGRGLLPLPLPFRLHYTGFMPASAELSAAGRNQRIKITASPNRIRMQLDGQKRVDYPLSCQIQL
jgi:hypothetical protein